MSPGSMKDPHFAKTSGDFSGNLAGKVKQISYYYGLFGKSTESPSS